MTIVEAMKAAITAAGGTATGETISELFDDYTAAVSGGGGGGGASVYTVEIVEDGDDFKTVQNAGDIYEAYASGKIIQCKFDGMTVNISVCSEESGVYSLLGFFFVEQIAVVEGEAESDNEPFSVTIDDAETSAPVIAQFYENGDNEWHCYKSIGEMKSAYDAGTLVVRIGSNGTLAGEVVSFNNQGSDRYGVVLKFPDTYDNSHFTVRGSGLVDESLTVTRDTESSPITRWLPLSVDTQTPTQITSDVTFGMVLRWVEEGCLVIGKLEPTSGGALCGFCDVTYNEESQTVSVTTVINSTKYSGTGASLDTIALTEDTQTP